MSPGAWTATLQVRRPDAAGADRLYRALSPEAEREVPRARSRLRRGPGPVVALEIGTQDTGALRAALNTYLGWIDLADATERTIAGFGTTRSVGAGPAAAEAVK